MKKIITLLSFLSLFFIAVNAQAQNKTAYAAVTGYDKASLEKALSAKTFEFTLNGVSDDEAKNMQKSAAPYVKLFDVTFTGNGNGQVCKIAFKENVDMKMLYRFFIAANITEITYNNAKTSSLDFFRTWM